MDELSIIAAINNMYQLFAQIQYNQQKMLEILQEIKKEVIKNEETE